MKGEQRNPAATKLLRNTSNAHHIITHRAQVFHLKTACSLKKAIVFAGTEGVLPEAQASRLISALGLVEA